ncbi:hypothetical protein GCM10010399_89830 [Dactylosporangium fulvum]
MGDWNCRSYRRNDVKLQGWARRSITIVGVTAALTLASTAFASQASANSAVAYTGTSPQGGWGVGYWDNGSSAERKIEACDSGSPDGRRAVAILAVDGVGHEIHASGGAGNCSGPATISGLKAGSSYSFRACLRDGANGANVYCSPWQRGTVK